MSLYDFCQITTSRVVSRWTMESHILLTDILMPDSAVFVVMCLSTGASFSHVNSSSRFILIHLVAVSNIATSAASPSGLHTGSGVFRQDTIFLSVRPLYYFQNPVAVRITDILLSFTSLEPFVELPSNLWPHYEEIVSLLSLCRGTG